MRSYGNSVGSLHHMLLYILHVPLETAGVGKRSWLFSVGSKHIAKSKVKLEQYHFMYMLKARQLQITKVVHVKVVLPLFHSTATSSYSHNSLWCDKESASVFTNQNRCL